MIDFTCIGKIASVPELKETQSGLKFCNLIIKANRPYANADGKIESDEYSVTCWKQLAEDMCKESKPDETVYIRGRLQANNYVKDDDSHYRAELIASTITVLPEA